MASADDREPYAGLRDLVERLTGVPADKIPPGGITVVTATPAAVEWAKRARAEARSPRLRRLLAPYAGVEVEVVCSTCGKTITVLTPALDRADGIVTVMPVRGSDLGSRYRANVARDGTGVPLTGWERVRLICPDCPHRTAITAPNLVERFVLAARNARPIRWPS